MLIIVSISVQQNSLTRRKLSTEQFFCILKHVLSNAVFFVVVLFKGLEKGLTCP